MLNLKHVRQFINEDSIGKNKAGNIVIRRGYFYTNGMDSDKFAASVVARLNQNGINVKVVDKGNNWKPFRGSASVAKSSHFFVEITEA